MFLDTYFHGNAIYDTQKEQRHGEILSAEICYIQ